MTKVFIGGSRRVSRLNAEIRRRTDQIMDKRYMVLVGDANGADKAIQTYLASHNYSDVMVYCVAQRCRNNVGNWPVHPVTPPNSHTGFAFFAAKDVAMAQDADCGMMLWDGESKGTLHNILNLLQSNKKALVFLALTHRFYTLTSSADLKGLLAFCGPAVEKAIRELPQAEVLRAQTQPELELHACGPAPKQRRRRRSGGTTV